MANKNSDSPTLFELFSELGKHGAIYGLSSIVNGLTAFLLIPLYTTVLPSADYGTLGLIVLTGQIGGLLFGLSLTSSLSRSFYDYSTFKEQQTVVSTAIGVILVSGSLMLVLSTLFAGDLSNWLFSHRSFAPYFIVVAVYTLLTLLNETAFVIFRLQKRSTLFAIMRFVSFLVEISVIIYLVAFREMGIWGVLIGRLAASLGILLPLAWLLRKFISVRLSAVEARKMIRYGFPLTLAGVSGFVFIYIDRYFLNYYINLGEVGVYTLANQFGIVMNILLIAPIKMVWGPMFLSIKENDNFTLFCARALTYIVLLGGVLFLSLSLLAREAIRLMSTPEYWSAYSVVPIIALTYWIWSTRSVIEVGVAIKRQTLFVAANSFMGATINVLLNIVLVPSFGMTGAAYATLITYMAMIGVDYVYNQRLLPIGYEWVRLGKISLASALLFGIGYFLIFNNILLSIGFKLALVGSYPCILWVMGFFEPVEVRRLREMVKLKHARI